jgi:hypothetical protein
MRWRPVSVLISTVGGGIDVCTIRAGEHRGVDGDRLRRPAGAPVDGETIQRSAAAPDRWSVTTDRGTTTVDNTGAGSAVVPLDLDIQADLYLHGDGYLVTSTSIGLESSTEEDSSIERGDDLGLG